VSRDGGRRFKCAFPDQFKSVALLVGGLLWGVLANITISARIFQWKIRKRTGGMTSCNIATSLMTLNACKPGFDSYACWLGSYSDTDEPSPHGARLLSLIPPCCSQGRRTYQADS
jgi:hypothetical protein